MTQAANMGAVDFAMVGVPQWRPRLELDARTQSDCAALAGPFLGKSRLPRLCKAVRGLLERRFIGYEIGVTNFTRPEDRKAKIIKLMVLVGGKPDQGLVFGFVPDPVTSDTRARDLAEA